MPDKYAKKKGWNVPKQKYKLRNWSEYNDALMRRGDITIRLSADAVAQWYERERVYDGTGTPRRFTDFAIIACHEIRQVYRLPLRQPQGFINSLFRLMGFPLSCPNFSCISKRLKELKIKVPKYKKTDKPLDRVHAIAIDSTGLKRFERGEWHQEKYELSSKASWCKLHVGVNQNHYFEACELTDRFTHDDQLVKLLLAQINEPIDHFSGDGAYDEAPIYDALFAHLPNVDVLIPPRSNAVLSDNSAAMRNRNIQEINDHGRMQWQKQREYGRRNYSELGVQRYQKILGDSLHVREITSQKQEAIIGCGVINKMTSLGIPESYRSA
ncbi:IS5-like element ISLlo3 family transposase [Legionella longbeachae]|uniref:IS5-like element ISLlo3 family transposase n=1 Tax=Legionella longbeachae TaxID=450 RepID=UPI000A1BFFFF|nr:IS5-like element ISLlo3 family transposase [Legionella longbeachae]ARM32344.1 IS5-like element ISLlo3 family transposase [Legionella longbeachae]